MSAYVVDHRHIDAILTAALHLTRANETLAWYHRPENDCEVLPFHLDAKTVDRVGAVLLAENVRSVNHRYGEDDIEHPYEFNRVGGAPTPVHLMGLLHCFEYQACEHPDWRDSEAYAIVRRLERLAMSRLPGYGTPWSVSDSDKDVFAVVARR